jgi:hypothetical protein
MPFKLRRHVIDLPRGRIFGETFRRAARKKFLERGARRSVTSAAPAPLLCNAEGPHRAFAHAGAGLAGGPDSKVRTRMDSAVSHLPQYFGRRFGVAPKDDTEHLIKCLVCGQWIDYRNLPQVFQHAGPLPHPAEVKPE